MPHSSQKRLEWATQISKASLELLAFLIGVSERFLSDPAWIPSFMNIFCYQIVPVSYRYTHCGRNAATLTFVAKKASGVPVAFRVVLPWEFLLVWDCRR
jgi:hypothetical protein